MRYLSTLLILLIFLSLQLGCAIASQSKKETVLEIFKKSIELNEDFKAGITVLPFEKQNEKRRILEQYQETKLSYALENCVILLSYGNDTVLANSFFDLLLSLENSADEKLAYAFGELYLKNPDLVLKNFENYNKSDQNILFRLLKFGFENVIVAQRIPETEIQQHFNKLKNLESRIHQK